MLNLRHGILISQAGMVILREAGGYCSGGAKAFARHADDAEILLGRRVVAIRPVARTEVCRISCLHTLLIRCYFLSTHGRSRTQLEDD